MRGGGELQLAYIKISENERFESALRRFKRQCENEGLLK
ncbi:MAG: 30S ribosomal protein S21, partial [Candidatus Omnitrophota bacterium]